LKYAIEQLSNEVNSYLFNQKFTTYNVHSYTYMNAFLWPRVTANSQIKRRTIRCFRAVEKNEWL